MTYSRTLGALTVFLCWSSAFAADWVNWRGPEQNGVARDTHLPSKWSPDPKAKDNNLIWKAPVASRSTPLVMNGRVYLINKVGEGVKLQERVMCLDAKDGKVLWQHPFNVFHTDIVEVRLGWSNLAGDPETGNIYAHGTQGMLYCFSKDGKVLWSRSLTEEYGRISGYGGRVTTPIVDGDLVILTMLNASWGDQGRGGNRFLALDKKTGAPVWWGSTGILPKNTYYSCPVVAVIGGQRLVISGGGDGGVHAFKVRTGEKVWSYVLGTGAVNCSPVVSGNLVYIGQGGENPDNNIQGRVVCLDGSKVKDGKPALVWKVDDIKVKYASPILHDGRLYVCDEGGTMFCLDAKDGKELWNYSYGTDCKGSPVWADAKIYISETDGQFHILEPGKDECKELHTQAFKSTDRRNPVKIYGSPAVADGRIYFCTTDGTYCIGLKNRKAPLMIPEPQPVKETPPDKNAKAAHLQVLPADVVVVPGQSVSFKVRAFDDHGRFLREEKAEWSLAPMGLPAGLPAPPPGKGPPPLKGTITSEGKLTVDKAMPGQFGMVEAKIGKLTGKARVRVAPQLPYKQDFSKVPEGRVPAGWVNCQGKFAVRKKDGKDVLVKLAVIPSPLVARANAFIAMPDLKDYTIQADVMGGQKGKDLPDMGIVANRYSLLLVGSTQSLRLVSWDALPRVDKTISFPWKPGVWYRLKLTTRMKGDKGIIQGKAWEADKPEPKDWTVEFEDPLPNRTGSPALYGYATGITDKEPGAEAFYSNVSVTPNGK